jgi:signal transduction histidine kinase
MDHTILVIEDEEPLRLLLKAELEHEGFKVETAENGEAALKMIKKNPPDLIVCDVMMPIMDGFTFQEKINQTESFKDIPLIFLTAKSDKADIRFGKSLGADDYITKPFDFEDLKVSVNAKLKKAIRQKQYLNSRLDDIRKSILYSIPHEFKNPLSTLSGFVSLLQDKDYIGKEEERQEFLKYIQSSSDRLNRLVTNFLRLAELEILASNEEKVSKLKQNKNVNWLIEFSSFVNDFSTQQNIPVQTELIGEKFPITPDYNALNMILSELLLNAYNFSEPENINIFVNAVATDTLFEMSVRDTGKGIEDYALKSLTDVFYQHNRQFHEQQGGGLGLTIVNRIVQIYDGKMEIESEVGRGTEVKIFIPLYL